MIILFEQIIELSLVISTTTALIDLFHALQVGKGDLIRSQANHRPVSSMKVVDP
jgi:hypothetical protein